jgi:hypothetical protein
MFSPNEIGFCETETMGTPHFDNHSWHMEKIGSPRVLSV